MALFLHLYGATSSNPKIKDIYQGLKKLNYKITLHALFASAASRAGAINFRNETFVQVTLRDAKTRVFNASRLLEENSLSAFITTLYNSSFTVAGSSGAATVDVSSGLVGDDSNRALPQVKF